MSRLATPRDLPQLTLVAVDTRAPLLALEGLERSLRHIRPARSVLFTHAAPADVVSRARELGVDLADCGPIASGADYSRFVLREMPLHIATSHVLVTQWDGFVVDGRAWRDEFLEYDYIGAPWIDAPDHARVGNGGFSLRSRRLLQAGRDARIVECHPEDVALCRTYRRMLEQDHGVRFAPLAVARRFAFENERPSGPTLGFHGPYNLPLFVDAATVSRWLAALPDEFFRSRDARRLARALIREAMPGPARQLLTRRRAAGRSDLNTLALSGLAGMLGLWHGWRTSAP